LNISKEFVIIFLFQGQHKDLMADRKKRGEIRSKKLAEENEKFKSFWEKETTYEERPTQE
jgi:hypothetical protein